MLIKAGVGIEALHRNIRRSLGTVAAVFDSFGELLVITETYGGNHGAGSLHYANEAYDVRNPVKNKVSIVTMLKEKLGADFDVVDEIDHIHIEYDPK